MEVVDQRIQKAIDILSRPISFEGIEISSEMKKHYEVSALQMEAYSLYENEPLADKAQRTITELLLKDYQFRKKIIGLRSLTSTPQKEFQVIQFLGMEIKRNTKAIKFKNEKRESKLITYKCKFAFTEQENLCLRRSNHDFLYNSYIEKNPDFPIRHVEGIVVAKEVNNNNKFSYYAIFDRIIDSSTHTEFFADYQLYEFFINEENERKYTGNIVQEVIFKRAEVAEIECVSEENEINIIEFDNEERN